MEPLIGLVISLLVIGSYTVGRAFWLYFKSKRYRQRLGLPENRSWISFLTACLVLLAPAGVYATDITWSDKSTGGTFTAADANAAKAAVNSKADQTEVDLNTAKDTNATHTGEVTGSTALTIADSVVGVNNMDTNVSAMFESMDGLAFDKPSMSIVSDSGLKLDVGEVAAGGDMRFLIDGVISTLDCTTGAGASGDARVALTAGSDAHNPVTNYIYVTDSGGTATLAASTSLPTGAFAWIGKIIVPDATTWATTGAYVIQRYTEAFTNGSRGTQSNAREKLRALGAVYINGVSQSMDITTNGGAADNVHIDVTTGSVYQLHRQTWPAMTSGQTYYYGNGPNIYDPITDLNAALSEVDGDSLSGKRFNLVIWGAVNLATGDCKLFVNLPTKSYGKNADAMSDKDGSAVYSVPPDFRSVAFLISRIAFRHTTADSGTWSTLGLYSLLGSPLGNASSGAGAVASNEYDDGLFTIYNTTDLTKELDFDVSEITTGTERTITMPDSDVDLGDIATKQDKAENYTALKAITAPVDGDAVLVTNRATDDDSGGGTFWFDGSDLSTEVTSDTAEGIYVPPDSDDTGASGAWRRIYNGELMPEFFGAVESVDATTAIAATIVQAIALKEPILFTKDEYVVGTGLENTSIFTGAVFRIPSGTDGLTLVGSNSTLVDMRDMATQGTSFTPLFHFISATNITVDKLNYRSDDTYVTSDLANRIGYYGMAYLLFTGDCEHIRLDYKTENARYGVKTGDYGTYAYSGLRGVVDLEANIRGVNTGYVIAIEYGSNIKFDVTSDVMHRAVYLAGVTNVRGNILARNQYIAPSYCLISSSRYEDSGVQYVGSHDVDITVIDNESDSPDRESHLFGLQSYDFAGRDAVRFSDIHLRGQVLEGATTTVGGFTMSFAEDIADIVDNVSVSFTSLSNVLSTVTRMTTTDSVVVNGFTFYDFVSLANDRMYFTLGENTTIKLDNVETYLAMFGDRDGSTTYIEDCDIYDIKPTVDTNVCGQLVIDSTDSYTVIEDSPSFSSIDFGTSKAFVVQTVDPTGTGETTSVPSEVAVGDALALKQDAADIQASIEALSTLDLSDVALTLHSTNALDTDITYETLATNGDVGPIAGQLAIGDHNHDSDYAPSAIVTKTATAANAFSAGTIGYLASAGTITLADADTEASTKNMLFMATESVSGGASGDFSKGGAVTVNTHGLAVGAPIFISTTAGALTNTAPGTGKYVRILGYAVSADIIEFTPSVVWIEVE